MPGPFVELSVLGWGKGGTKVSVALISSFSSLQFSGMSFEVGLFIFSSS